MSASASHGEKAWKRNDVVNLIAAIGSQLSEQDILSIEYAFKAACSIAESSDPLPEIDVTDYINSNGRINWRAIEDAEPDHARVFVIAEELLNQPCSLAFKKRLRDLMHEAKKWLTTFQLADRLFLALKAISSGSMPSQERGSFEYMRWFFEMIDWIENLAQPTFATVRSSISDTSYVNWDVLEFGRDLFLVDMELCRMLANIDHIPFKMREEEFNVESTADNQFLCGRALYKAFTAERARAFNQGKIKLCADLSRSALDDGSIALLQPSNYYSAIATNEAANLILHSRVGQRTLRGDVFCMVNGTMRKLIDSRCSSQIGGNSLAFTTDGYLGLHIQTEDNFVGKGLSPSCSGSIDLEDVQAATHLGELIVSGTERELREEAQVRKNEQTTRLMGYAICAHRGYKPDFFLVTRLKMTLADLRGRHVARDASIEEFVGPHYYVEVGKSAFEVISSIERLLDSCTYKLPESNGEGTTEVPFGNVLILALTLLHMHLTYCRDSVISQFLFDSQAGLATV
ncbi:MAG: hypothetical protein ACR2HJ_07810 [Fimbriimonadales bacterium]